jgi:adenylate cyclase
MKRAFSTSSIEDDASNYLNSNSYIKLMNSSMDPLALTRQLATSSPEGFKFLTQFLAKQCSRFQSVMKSLIEIAQQPALDKAAQKLFDIMMQVTDAQYGTIYFSTIAGSPLKVFNNNWPVSRQTVLEDHICASDAILKGDLVNIYNLKASDYYKGPIPSAYTLVEPSCILSAPFYGDGLRITGIIELINKKSGNPVFSAEDEFMMRALSSITTIIFNQINVKQSATKKTDNLKTFFAATTGNPTTKIEMGDLLNAIIETARELVNAERCTIFLYDEESDQLWSKLAHGSASEIRVPSNKGLAGYVFQSGDVCNTQDAYADSRFNQVIDLASGYRTQTILTVPMRNQSNEIVGVIQAINKKPYGFVFDNDDVSQLQSFASLAASSLEKSSDILELTDLVAIQKSSLLYASSLLKSIRSVVITIDTDGRANIVENSHLINMDKNLELMRSTSFENWLGRDNYAVADSILKVSLTGQSVTVHNFQFSTERAQLSVTYEISKLSSLQNKGQSDLIQRRSTIIRRESKISRKSVAEVVCYEASGLLLTITPTIPNRYLTEQVGTQISPKLLNNLYSDPAKLEGEYQPVTALVLDIRKCNISL